MANKFEALEQSVNTAIKDAPGGMLPYTGMLISSLNALRASTEKTTAAFAQGNTMAGLGGIAEMTASVGPLIGCIGGPFGVTLASIVSGFLALLGGVLTSLEGQRKSLRQEMDEALDRLHAKMIRDELRAAEEDFIAGIAVLNEMDDKSRTWEQLQTIVNLAEGNATHQLNVSKSWLSEEEKNKQWADAFKLYWEVASLRTQYFALALPKLVETGDARKIGLKASQNQLERDRLFARALYRPGVDAGQFWHIGTKRQLFFRDKFVPEGGWDRLEWYTDDFALGREMAYGLDNEGHYVWAGRQGNRIKHDRKVVGLSVLPIRESNLAAESADEVLFLLLEDGHTVLVEKIDRSAKTQDKDLKASGRTIQFNGTAPVRQLLASFAGTDASTRNLTRFFVLQNQDQIRVGEVAWGVSSAAGKEPINHSEFFLLRVPGQGRVVSIAQNYRHLYAHTESTIHRTPILRATTPVSYGPWEEIKDIPGDVRGKKIEAIAAGSDGQLLAVFEGRIWARYEPILGNADKVSWASEKGAYAYQISKRAIDGFDACLGYLHASLPGDA